MNSRLLSVFVFALVVSSAVSFLIYRLLVGHVQSGTPLSTTTLVLADRDLGIGTLIQSGDVRASAWSGTVPTDAFLKTEDAVGRGVITKIYQGEPVVAGRVAGRGAGAGLAATIPMGMRAVALRVNDVVGLAGFVLPGMRVDVLVTGNAPGADQSRAGTVSRTVLQNLEVLSANQRIEHNSAGKPEDAQVVNLLVTPDQAEIMNLASNEGKVQLVLRNPLDQVERPTHGSNSAAMFGGSSQTALLTGPDARSIGQTPTQTSRRPRSPIVHEAPVPKAVSVEVFSGAKRSEQQF